MGKQRVARVGLDYIHNCKPADRDHANEFMVPTESCDALSEDAGPLAGNP